MKYWLVGRACWLPLIFSQSLKCHGAFMVSLKQSHKKIGEEQRDRLIQISVKGRHLIVKTDRNC